MRKSAQLQIIQRQLRNHAKKGETDIFMSDRNRCVKGGHPWGEFAIFYDYISRINPTGQWSDPKISFSMIASFTHPLSMISWVTKK